MRFVTLFTDPTLVILGRDNYTHLSTFFRHVGGLRRRGYAEGVPRAAAERV